MKRFLVVILSMLMAASVGAVVEFYSPHNTATRVPVDYRDNTDGTFITAATGSDCECSEYNDGTNPGTFADCTNEATEIATSSGTYYLQLTASETDSDYTLVKCTSTSSNSMDYFVRVSHVTRGVDFDDVDGGLGASEIETDAIGADEIAADAVGAAEAGFLTDSTGFAGANIDAAVSSRSTVTAAQVNTEVDTALADARLDELLLNDSDIDGAAPPTDGSVFQELMTSSATGFTYVQADDALQAISESGGGGPTAAQIADAVWDETSAGHTGAGTAGEQQWTDVDAILVDTAEIGAAGAGLTEAGATGDHLTAVPWNAAWDVQVESEVTDGLEADHLDHLLAADYDPASKPGIATALLNELVESDAGVSRYTANALEQAPSGSGLTAITTGTAQAATATSLQLAAPETFADGELVGAVAHITGGTTGVGQTKCITAYTGATDTATVTTWTTTPTGTITYEIIPSLGSECPVQVSDDTAPIQVDSGGYVKVSDGTGTGQIALTGGAIDTVTTLTNEPNVWDDATRTLTAATNITDDGGTINVTGGAVDTVTSLTNPVTASSVTDTDMSDVTIGTVNVVAAAGEASIADKALLDMGVIVCTVDTTPTAATTTSAVCDLTDPEGNVVTAEDNLLIYKRIELTTSSAPPPRVGEFAWIQTSTWSAVNSELTITWAPAIADAPADGDVFKIEGL